MATLCAAHKKVSLPVARMFQPGDKVFAKMKGFPFWPARVEAVPSYVDVPKGKLPVFFYGTHQVSFLAAKNLISYEINKDSHGKRKNLMKAMAEIESDPDILCLGKDPAAENFWQSLYPNSASKVQKRARQSSHADSSGLSSRSISPASRKSSKRKCVSKTKKGIITKRRKHQSRDDDVMSISSLSDEEMNNPCKTQTDDSETLSISKSAFAPSLPSTAGTDDEHETSRKEPSVNNSSKRRRNTSSVPDAKRPRKGQFSSETVSLSGESKSEDELKTPASAESIDLENQSFRTVRPPLTPPLESEAGEHEVDSLEGEEPYRTSHPKKEYSKHVHGHTVDLDSDDADEKQDGDYQEAHSEEQLVMVNNEPDSDSSDSSQCHRLAESTSEDKIIGPRSGRPSPANSDHMPSGDVASLGSGSVMELPKTPPSQIEEADESNSSRPAVEAPRCSDSDGEDEMIRIRRKRKVEQRKGYSGKTEKGAMKELKTPKPDKSATQSPSTPVYQESEKRDSKTPRPKPHRTPRMEAESIQMLRDLCLKLKSSLVKGHENFEAAVRFLHQVAVADVSLSQITQVWELTDCVKKCRKYRLSAEVRAAADKAMQHFQHIQATASREELLKAKTIIEERQRNRSETTTSTKTSPPPVASAPFSTGPASSSSTSDPIVVTPTADENARTTESKRQLSLEKLRAELDEKANSVLAHIAALEERLKNSSSNVKTTPTGVSNPAATVPATGVGHSAEVTASDVVLSRVDAVATRLRVPDVAEGAPAASGLSPPPPPPPPPPLPLPLGGTLSSNSLVSSSSSGGPVDLETRIHQLMGGGFSGGAVKSPAASSSETSLTQSKLLALRDQIQKKRRAAAAAAAAKKAKDDRGKSADDDIYDLLGV